MTSQRPNMSTGSRSGNTVMSEAPTRFGTIKPNLIVHYDAGNGEHLFLLQCEVPIGDQTEFETVHSGLEEWSKNKSTKALADVKAIVTKDITPGASKIFRDIIELGFQDNAGR